MLRPPRSSYNFDPMAMSYESGGGGSVVGETFVGETSARVSGDKQQQRQQRRPTSPLEMTANTTSTNNYHHWNTISDNSQDIGVIVAPTSTRRRRQFSHGETNSFLSSPTTTHMTTNTKITSRMETTTTMFTTDRKKIVNDENDRSRDNQTLIVDDDNDNDDENDNENHIFRTSSSKGTSSSSNSNSHQTQPQPPNLSDFLINDICYQNYLLEGRRPTRYRGLGSTSAKRNNNRKRGQHEGESGSIMDPTFIANACAIYCFIAMIFLTFVAIIIETQPLFIKGVSVKSSSSTTNMHSSSSTNNRFGSDIEYDPTYYDNYYYSCFRKETSNALKASAAYFVVMVSCYVYLQAKDMNYLEYSIPFLANISGRMCHTKRVIVSSIYRYRRRHYDDIPDHDSYDELPPSSSSLVVRRDGEGGRRRTMTTVLPTHHHNSSNGYGEGGMLKSRGVRKKVVGDNNGQISSSSPPWSTTSIGIGMGAVSPPPTTTTISSSSSVVGDAIENVWVKVKSWGSGEGSLRTGRKKDR